MRLEFTTPDSTALVKRTRTDRLVASCFARCFTVRHISPKIHEASLIGNFLKNRRTFGIAALCVGVICWGVTPVILRRLTEFIDPWTANAIRYPMSAILYWPLLAYLCRTGKLTRDLGKRCLVPALLSLGGQIFWALAYYELQASEVGFFIRLSTAWAILGALILFSDERKLLGNPNFYLGLVIIIAGFLVMSLKGGTVDESATADGNYQLGILYVFLSSTFFGFYVVSIRYFLPTVNPLHSFSIVVQIVSIGVILAMMAFGDFAAIGKQTTLSWTLLIASTILGIAVGHVLMYAAVQRLGASITSSCQSLLPFVTAAVAWATLGEQLSNWQWAGGLMMIAGALLLLFIKNEIGAVPDKRTG